MYLDNLGLCCNIAAVMVTCLLHPRCYQGFGQESKRQSFVIITTGSWIISFLWLDQGRTNNCLWTISSLSSNL